MLLELVRPLQGASSLLGLSPVQGTGQAASPLSPQNQTDTDKPRAGLAEGVTEAGLRPPAYGCCVKIGLFLKD